MNIWPSVGSSSPAIIRSVVLLPQPDGPTSTRNSLFGITRSNVCTATKLSQRLVIFLSTTSATDCHLSVVGHSVVARGDRVFRAARRGGRGTRRRTGKRRQQ